MKPFIRHIERLIWPVAVWYGLFSPVVRAQVAPPDSVRSRVILIGDAGRLRDGRNPVVEAIAARHDLNNARTTLLYLGDNLYSKGLSDVDAPEYKAQTEVLRAQVQPGLGKQSRVLFMPGNHDWGQGRPDGFERIRQQGRWIDSLNAPNIQMLPVAGCPGPEEIGLNANLVLVIMDTQWWLHPYDKPSEDSDCACHTGEEVLTRLADIARRNRDKTLLVATHHPLRSHGLHGGYYTLKQHLFPLTEFAPNLYVPLPLIGSLYPLVRGAFGNIQDLRNPRYRDMVRAIEAALSPAPNVVYVAGHDHNLQHIVEGNRHYIVSGAGINRERVKSSRTTRFASSDLGYFVLDESVNGTVTMTAVTVGSTGAATESYHTPLFRNPNTDSIQRKEPSVQRVENQHFDSVSVAIAPSYDRVGNFHRKLLGQNYRQTWATAVSFPVFDLQRTKGGFQILQRGGGMQTRSLRLRDTTGREWVLRSVQKDPAKALPEALRQTIARQVLQDEISAAFPYGPLVVPPIAEALGVPHANPTLVYIPDDPALGIYQEDFANSVALLEVREPGGGKSISTAKLLVALDEDNDNRVDERSVLRARLLDWILGDWDRHEDQWRWGIRKTKRGNGYFPIPRDRDQVFFRPDGLLPTIAAQPWLQPKFQGFRPKIADINGFMFNARHVDRRFLSGLSANDWLHEIADVQLALTDSVLNRAMAQLPEPIRQQSGQQLLTTLRARRAQLCNDAMTYYRFLTRTVDIPGSDKAELFRVTYKTDAQIAVSVFNLKKDGTPGARLYERVFDEDVTREIRLFGQKGDDRFELLGSAKNPITVRLIGGKGDDVFTMDGRPSKPAIYDQIGKQNTLPQPGRARLHLSTSKTVNQYDPHAFKYDKVAPLLSAGYNVDDGVILGAGIQWTRQGFRKTPFASQQKLLINRSLATEAFNVRYSGRFTKLIGQNDLQIDALIKAPSNVTNFFGEGNETIYEEGRRIRHYRTRYNLMTVTAQLKRQMGDQLSLSLGPVMQYFNLDLEDNRGRFIESYLAGQPEGSSFLKREGYVGLQTGLILDSRDHSINPSHGVYWNTTLTHLRGFSEQTNQFTQLRSEFSFFTRLDPAGRFVLANRLGGGLTGGNPAFYQLLYLGGQENLRGFRAYRFAGHHLLYHNLEVRAKLFDFQSFLFPGSVGLMAFNDIGRVWTKNETSRRLHHGYGGGLYLTPASLLLASVTVGISDEGVLPYFSLGFRF